MADISQISKIYFSLFNRAIDSTIAAKYKDDSFDVNLVNKIIAEDPKLREMDDASFIKRVYNNALDKTEQTDQEGINFWIELLKSGNTKIDSKEEFLYEFIVDVNKYLANQKDPSLMTDNAKAGLKVFNTKLAVSNAAADQVGGVTNDDLTFGAGLPAINAGNADTQQTQAISRLPEIAKKNPPITPGGKEVTLGSGENFTKPGPEATEEEIAKGATDATDKVMISSENFTADTKIDAAGGYDILTVDLKNDLTVQTGQISNVERITLENSTNSRKTFDANSTKGVNIYDIYGSNGVNISNINYHEGILINVDGLKSASNDLITKISFDTIKTGGILAMSLNNVGYDSDDNGKSNQKFDLGSGIGQLSLQITGENYADITSEGVNRITLAGNGTLDTNLSKGVVYFDAQNATGNLIVRATETADVGDNGNNIFEHFSTGSGKDDVTIDVSRLAQEAKIDLGAGEDTLRLQGYMRKKDEKQYYNINTVEHLAIGPIRTQDAGTGTDGVLLLDLGTGGTSDTANRSANLKKITIEHGGSTSIENLGSKNLDVIFNGANKSDGTLTKVTLDHSGTTNLVLQGDGDNEGAGFVNVDYTKELNIDLTGQGFNGAVSAGDATKITISNRTTDKTLTLQAASETGDRADWTNVKTIDIDTSTQRANITAVKLEQIDMPIVETINLRGIGDVEFRNLSNDTTGISINGGASFTGKLTTGNIYAGTQKVSIATKGAIQTGEITGSNVSIDLSGSKTASNDIGKITLLDGTGSNEGTGGTGGTVTQSSTLTYKTGFEGTKGTGEKDTQEIEVVSKNATLNLFGRDGVDKFNIVASKFTTNLTIKGNLGTSATDSVVVDLSKTSGATLDTKGLVVNRLDGAGVNITASKGQDNITLSAGTDVVEFKAGGKAGVDTNGDTLAKVEEATITAPELKASQFIEFFGLKLTATTDATDAEVAKAIAALLKAKGDKDNVDANLLSTDKFKVEGTANKAQFNEFSKVWSITDPTTGAITVTSKKMDNIMPDLDKLLKFTTSAKVDAPQALSIQDKDVIDGVAAANATFTVASGGDQFTASNLPNTKVATLNITLDDYKINGGVIKDLKIVITNNDGADLDKQQIANVVADILGGKATGAAQIKAATTTIKATFSIEGGDKAGSYTIDAKGAAGGSAAAATYTWTGASTTPFSLLPTGMTVASNAGGNVVPTGPNSPVDVPSAIGISGTFDTTDVGNKKIGTGTDGTPATKATVKIELQGLNAGQSYTIDGKTVTATGTLTAEQVAQAFTKAAGNTDVAGAVISGEFSKGGNHLGDTALAFAFRNEGSTFIAEKGTAGAQALTQLKAELQKPEALKANGTDAPKITITTKEQGISSDTFNADSYITIRETQKGSISGDIIKEHKFILNDKNLDTLNNFDINNDKLNIAKFNEQTALWAGAFNSDDVLTNIDSQDTGLIIGTTGGETSGGTTQPGTGTTPKESVSLSFSVDATGIVQFTAKTATKGQLDNYDIKLEYKFAVLQGIGHNEIVAFAHGNDVYVVAGGSDDTKTTDDVVVKLTGVATNGVTALDLGNILA